MKLSLDARKILFGLHILEFIVLLISGIFLFSLPSFQDEVTTLAAKFDLFYKVIINFGVGFLISKYTLVGLIITILAFTSLISALIVHGYFVRILFINKIFSFILFFIYPIGTLLSLINFYFIYVYKKNTPASPNS